MFEGGYNLRLKEPRVQGPACPTCIFATRTRLPSGDFWWGHNNNVLDFLHHTPHSSGICTTVGAHSLVKMYGETANKLVSALVYLLEHIVLQETHLNNPSIRASYPQSAYSNLFSRQSPFEPTYQPTYCRFKMLNAHSPSRIYHPTNQS